MKLSSALLLIAHQQKASKKQLLHIKKNLETHSSFMLKTASISAASMLLGDLICQYIASSSNDTAETDNGMSSSFDSLSPKEQLDMERGLRMALVGFCATGPFNYVLIQIMEKLFGSASNMKTVVKKVGFQSAFSPVFILLTLVMSEALKSSSTFEDVKDKLKRDYVASVSAAMCFWPIVSLLNNRFIPSQKRAAVSSLVGIFWNIIMSSMANGQSNKKAPHVPLHNTSNVAVSPAAEYSPESTLTASDSTITVSDLVFTELFSLDGPYNSASPLDDDDAHSDESEAEGTHLHLSASDLANYPVDAL